MTPDDPETPDPDTAVPCEPSSDAVVFVTADELLFPPGISCSVLVVVVTELLERFCEILFQLASRAV